LGTELLSILPEERCPALHYWQARLQSTVERTFSNKEKSLTHPARIGRVLRFADLYSQLRSLPTSGLARILHKPIVRGGTHPAICLDCGFPVFTSPAGELRVLCRTAAWTPPGGLNFHNRYDAAMSIY